MRNLEGTEEHQEVRSYLFKARPQAPGPLMLPTPSNMANSSFEVPRDVVVLQRRKDGAKVVGKLLWKLKSVRGLHVFNPYFEVIFEGYERM
jgi:hypothetical protein